MKNIKKTSFKLLCLLFTLQKSKFLLLIMGVLGTHSVAFTQTKKADYSISYDVQMVEFKKPKKGESNYSDIEKLDFVKETRSVDHFDILVYDNGDEEVTITHAHSNKAAPAFTQAAKTVIDDKGIRTYGQDGKELFNLEHSQVIKKFLKDKKQITKFQKQYQTKKLEKMTQVDIDNLKVKGVLIKQIQEGKYHLKNGNKEIICDVNKQELEERVFDGKELKKLMKKRISTTSDNYNYISLMTEVALESGVANHKIYRFVNTSTSNYKVKKLLNARDDNGSNNDSKELNFGISPNPAIDKITVYVPNIRGNYSLFITDISGKVLIKENVSAEVQDISIKNLPIGMYIAQLIHMEGYKQSVRFIKQ